MTLAYLLIAASAGILGVLGGLHLLYTFHGRLLEPRDPAVRTAMEMSSPVITHQTTMWRANKGFNASHGLGIVVFALVYGHLALWAPQVLGASRFLMALGMAALLGYLVLAQRYFFRIPFRGVTLACALYACGWALA